MWRYINKLLINVKLIRVLTYFCISLANFVRLYSHRIFENSFRSFTPITFIIVIGVYWNKQKSSLQRRYMFARTVSYIMRIKWIARWSRTKAVTCRYFSLSLSLLFLVLSSLSRSFRMIFDQTFSLSDWPNFRLLNTFVKKVGYPSKYGYSTFGYSRFSFTIFVIFAKIIRMTNSVRKWLIVSITNYI